MDQEIDTVWPSGLPETFWQLDKLQPEKVRDIPMAGFVLEPRFAAAFLAGALIIAFFAWRRFRERSFEPGSLDYRVLVELAPTELRGRNPMLRAYGLYVGALLLIYVAFAFFGKVLFDLAVYIPVSGLQFNAGNIDLNSPTWPLMLAFGFAGAIPLLKPLETVETCLRRWSHQRVGIPVRIRERTGQLLRTLRRGEKTDPAERAPETVFPSWVGQHVGDPEELAHIFHVQKDLRNFLQWRRGDEDIWPRGEVHEDLRSLEAKECAEARAALEDFEDLLWQDYDALPKSRADATAPAAAGGPPPITLQAHRKRLESNFDSIVDRMTRLRGEIAAILAVYAERDTEYDRIGDEALRRLLISAFAPHPSREGPEFGILAALPLVFVLYATFCAIGLHALLSDMPLKTTTVGLTAVMETARFSVLFLLPTLAVFNRRYFRVQNREWSPLRPWQPSYGLFARLLGLAALAFVVAALGQALLAVVWVTLIAENTDRLREILVGRSIPFLWFFVSQAGIAVSQALFAVIAADDPQDDPLWHRLRLAFYCVANAACVYLFMALHFNLWYAPWYCPSPGVETLHPAALFLFGNLFQHSSYGGTCFNYYGGLDLVLYTTFAALSPGPLLRMTSAAQEHPASAPVPPRAAGRAAPASALLLLAGLTLSLTSTAALAQPGPAAESPGRKPIVVGFRPDAEPFSFYIAAESGPRYRGYIADLCYDIFAGSRYEVIAVPISARDRFDRLRGLDDPDYARGTPAGLDTKLDVICDPVTVRFNRPGDSERIGGIFSPIIFISGVSYIHRPGESFGPTQLAYVENTTAREVVAHACRVDLFNLKTSGGAPGCPRAHVWGDGDNARHDTTFGANYTPCHQIPASREYRTRDKRRYEICVMRSHSELVRWLCAPPLPEKRVPERAYFGDRDIILGKLDAWLDKRPCPIDRIEKNQPTYTYEPYALVTSLRDPALVQHVQRRVYEFFSHRAAARAHFSAYFPGRGISTPLAMLFLLNAVDEEEFYLHSDLENGDTPVAMIPAFEPVPDAAPEAIAKAEEVFGTGSDTTGPIRTGVKATP